MKINKAPVFILIIVTLCIPLFAGGSQESPVAVEEAGIKPYKAAFIYTGIPGVPGWTSEHDRARRAAVEALDGRLETVYAENVPEGPDVIRIIRYFARQGCEMIWTTAPGYLEQTLEAAEEFPEIIFEHYSGNKTSENLGVFNGRLYQPEYLIGLVAGAVTETNVIGYIAAPPDYRRIRGINAFTLGVLKTNPNAVVKVIRTNESNDPGEEHDAAAALIEDGADIFMRKNGVWTVEVKIDPDSESDSHTVEFNFDSELVSALWDFTAYYTESIESAINGTWESKSYWGGLSDGIVKLSDFSDQVPEDVRSLVETEKERIESGSRDVFDGPVYDRSGRIVIAEGESPADAELTGMDWFVMGVEQPHLHGGR